MKPAVRQLLFGSQFTPAKLFTGGGSTSLWLDRADLPTMYQDSAATTAAAVGLPIGKASDKSGRGNNALQATSASRPVLRQDAAGLYYSEWDGFDDSMSCATGGGATAGFFFCAAITVLGGAGTTRRLWSDALIATFKGYVVSVDPANLLRFSAGNGVNAFNSTATVATLPVGETHVVTAWDDGTSLNVQIDRGAVASIARTVVAAGSAGFTIGKDNDAASNFFPGRDYGMVYRGSAPTATEIARTQRFFAARAGVTL